ncbi:hypothetical protein N806_10335 [Rhodococcus sp. P27]|nr:hypothetical protein N806_10335 [Rhodococcus sp. P27]
MPAIDDDQWKFTSGWASNLSVMICSNSDCETLTMGPRASCSPDAIRNCSTS